MSLYVLTVYFTLFIIVATIRNRHIIYKMWLYIKPFLTWRIIVCYLPFWFIATGWAWLFSFIGKGWLRATAITWLGILWLPFCPEKVITIPLAIWLHTKLFPKHSVPTVLTETLNKEKSKLKKRGKNYV